MPSRDALDIARPGWMRRAARARDPSHTRQHADFIGQYPKYQWRRFTFGFQTIEHSLYPRHIAFVNCRHELKRIEA